MFDSSWVPRAMTRSGVTLNPVVYLAIPGATYISLTKDQTANLKLGDQNWDWVWFLNGVAQPPILYGTVPIKDPITNVT